MLLIIIVMIPESTDTLLCTHIARYPISQNVFHFYLPFLLIRPSISADIFHSAKSKIT